MKFRIKVNGKLCADVFDKYSEAKKLLIENGFMEYDRYEFVNLGLRKTAIAFIIKEKENA